MQSNVPNERLHVGIIMDKLGARTRAGAVVTAIGRGLLLSRSRPTP